MWIEWFCFKVKVVTTIFSNFFGHQRAKIGPRRPQIKLFLKTHQIDIHTSFEEDSAISFPDDGQKPPFSIIFFVTRVLKLSQDAPKFNNFWTLTQLTETQSLKRIQWSVSQIMFRNHHFSLFWPLECWKWTKDKSGPKSNHFWTLTQLEIVDQWPTRIPPTQTAKIRMTCVTLTFDREMICDTLSPDGFYLCNIWT